MIWFLGCEYPRDISHAGLKITRIFSVARGIRGKFYRSSRYHVEVNLRRGEFSFPILLLVFPVEQIPTRYQGASFPSWRIGESIVNLLQDMLFNQAVNRKEMSFCNPVLHTHNPFIKELYIRSSTQYSAEQGCLQDVRSKTMSRHSYSVG